MGLGAWQAPLKEEEEPKGPKGFDRHRKRPGEEGSRSLGEEDVRERTHGKCWDCVASWWNGEPRSSPHSMGAGFVLGLRACQKLWTRTIANRWGKVEIAVPSLNGQVNEAGFTGWSTSLRPSPVERVRIHSFEGVRAWATVQMLSASEVSRHVSTRPSSLRSLDLLLFLAHCAVGMLLLREGPRPEPDEVRTEKLLKEITNNTPGLAC